MLAGSCAEVQLSWVLPVEKAAPRGEEQQQVGVGTGARSLLQKQPVLAHGRTGASGYRQEKMEEREESFLHKVPRGGGVGGGGRRSKRYKRCGPVSAGWVLSRKAKGCHPIPSQSTCLGFGPGPQLGQVPGTADQCFSFTSMFLSLSFSLPSPLSKNKNFLIFFKRYIKQMRTFSGLSFEQTTTKFLFSSQSDKF